MVICDSCLFTHKHTQREHLNAEGSTRSLWRDVSWHGSCETGLPGWEMGSQKQRAYSKTQPCQAFGCLKLTQCDLPQGILCKSVTSFCTPAIEKGICQLNCTMSALCRCHLLPCADLPAFNEQKDVKFMCLHSLFNINKKKMQHKLNALEKSDKLITGSLPNT